MFTRPIILLSPDAPANAAPPAAAPAPAPAPSPAPAPPRSEPSTPDPAAKLTDADIAEFDKAFGNLGENAPAKANEPPPANQPPPKPDATPKQEPPKPSEGEWDDSKIGKASPKELRDYAKKRATEAKTARDEVAAAQKRISDMEYRIADAEKKGKDTTALTERMTTLENQLKERETELRVLKNEASPEFKERFEKPYLDAAEEAKREIMQLEVVNPDGSTRKADWGKDFAAIYTLEYSQAKKIAAERFGDDAGIVMDHYRTLHRLDNAHQNALKQERANYPKLEQERQAKAAQSAQAQQAMFTKAFEAVGSKPEFQPVADDPEGNSLLEKGMKEFQLGMNESNFKTPAQKAIWTAVIGHRAASFHRLTATIAKKDTTIAELRSKIEELKGSNPHSGGGKKIGEKAPESEGIWADMPAELKES